MQTVRTLESNVKRSNAWQHSADSESAPGLKSAFHTCAAEWFRPGIGPDILSRSQTHQERIWLCQDISESRSRSCWTEREAQIRNRQRFYFTDSCSMNFVKQAFVIWTFIQICTAPILGIFCCILLLKQSDIQFFPVIELTTHSIAMRPLWLRRLCRLSKALTAWSPWKGRLGALKSILSQYLPSAHNISQNFTKSNFVKSTLLPHHNSLAGYIVYNVNLKISNHL